MEEYYSQVLEQVLEGLKNVSYNSCLIRYSGEFPIQNLDITGKLREKQDIYFAEHEFRDGEVAGGYEPYLSVICDMFRRHMTGDFTDFMEECDVYELHRPIILSYFNTGICKREEPLLLEEAAYEQERMTAAIENMLLRLAKECPIVLILNQFQLAARSTMVLTYRLLSVGNSNIWIVLGMNDALTTPEFLKAEWEAIYEMFEDESRIYHIGGLEKKKTKLISNMENDAGGKSYEKIKNLVELLDFEQASYLLRSIERRIKFDNLMVEEEARYKLLCLLARVSIWMKDIPKALEVCEDLERIHLPGKEEESLFEQAYLLATAYMYQGKLKKALDYAHKACEAGQALEDEYRIFLAQLMEPQIRMSGWYNIFFCAQDIEISEELIDKLVKYNFKNHLAYIYIYAYDNKPEMVAKAYQSEDNLAYFSKGIRIAKQIGNEHLINMAYEKNIMLASTNGMNEIALFYSVLTYEALKNKVSVEAGRTYSSIAYNLCAMGDNKRADRYYNKAISLFYQLHKSEDIAEVQYNKALSCIMYGEFDKAESYLTWCMKAVAKLHLNSLRVCNLSKLYGLLALVSILQKNRFRCEQYLDNCRQFLNYVLEKQKSGGGDINVVHDYAKVDDDMFLFTFSQALLAQYDGDEKRAAELYEQAEAYLEFCEGNQFFCMDLFYRCKTGCAKTDSSTNALAEEILVTLPTVEEDFKETTIAELDELLGQESVVLEYKSKKRQLDFISTWQNLIDVINTDAEDMVNAVMRTFLNHFNVDCAVYVRYRQRQPQVLFNNTEKEMTPETIGQLEEALKQTPEGFAISKISSNYAEHKDVTEVFGEDDVCSMVAVPFFNNEKMESFLVAYVRMKDNWHSSVNRYMLDEDDLNVYQMLFREVKYSLNRIEAYDKIYEMNTKLYLSAVTDQLTGIYNREGFYRKLNSLLQEFAQGERQPQMGLMFIDLDNFKYYNDTFGHDVGDFILVKMAEIFQKLSKERGFVCRYGGDEFIIVFYTAERAQLEAWAGQIYEMIAEAGGFVNAISENLGENIVIAKERQISCSIGIVAGENIRDEEEINRLIKQADDLLYSIKTSTKGTYRI